MVWDPELDTLDAMVLMPVSQAASCYAGLMQKLAAAGPAEAPSLELLLLRSRISVTLEAARKLGRFMGSGREIVVTLERLLADELLDIPADSGAATGNNSFQQSSGFSLNPAGPLSSAAAADANNPWLAKHLRAYYFGSASAGSRDIRGRWSEVF